MLSWEEFFKNIPFTYYRSSIIQNKYIETINRVANERLSNTIMEIASGSGYTSALVADLLSKNDTKVIATDVNENIVEKFRKFHTINNLSWNVEDSFNILLPDNSVDIIFHQGFLEHFEDDDIIKLLKEQARVANVIIFDVPNGRRNKKIQEFGNERFLSHKQWLSLVEKSGLKVIFHSGRRFTNTWKQFVPKIIYDTIWFGRHFGEASIIVCGQEIKSVKLNRNVSKS